jgi:hypothetical protein
MKIKDDRSQGGLRFGSSTLNEGGSRRSRLVGFVVGLLLRSGSRLSIMATGNFVSYLRVSTARQGQSSLGLEAQRQAVADFLNGGRWQLVKEFVEIESGKNKIAPSWRRRWLFAACAMRPW